MLELTSQWTQTCVLDRQLKSYNKSTSQTLGARSISRWAHESLIAQRTPFCLVKSRKDTKQIELIELALKWWMVLKEKANLDYYELNFTRRMMKHNEIETLKQTFSASVNFLDLWCTKFLWEMRVTVVENLVCYGAVRRNWCFYCFRWDYLDVNK